MMVAFTKTTNYGKVTSPGSDTLLLPIIKTSRSCPTVVAAVTNITLAMTAFAKDS